MRSKQNTGNFSHIHKNLCFTSVHLAQHSISPRGNPTWSCPQPCPHILLRTGGLFETTRPVSAWPEFAALPLHLGLLHQCTHFPSQIPLLMPPGHWAFPEQGSSTVASCISDWLRAFARNRRGWEPQSASPLTAPCRISYKALSPSGPTGSAFW